jgi:hypothetical protein
MELEEKRDLSKMYYTRAEERRDQIQILEREKVQTVLQHECSRTTMTYFNRTDTSSPLWSLMVTVC